MDKFVVVVIVAGISILTGAFGHRTYMGMCPIYNPTDSFDISKFSGRWHVIQQTDPDPPCYEYNFRLEKEGEITAIETVRNPFGLKVSHARSLSYEVLRPAKMNFVVGFGSNRHLGEQFDILLTNNRHYAVVFRCFPAGTRHHASIEILSRTPTLDRMIVQQIHDQLIPKGVNLDHVGNVDHSACA